MRTIGRSTGKLLAFAALAAAAHGASNQVSGFSDAMEKGQLNKYGQVVRSNIGNAVQQARKLKRRKAGKAAGQARKQNRK